jgi:hypothetical protein
MKQGFKVVLSAIALSSTLLPGLLASQAIARETQPVSVPAATDEAFFKNSRGFYDSQTTYRRVRELFGTGPQIFRRGTYGEISVERDAQLSNELYQRLMKAQSESDPTLRVPDLPNPFSSSLLTAPTAQAGSRFIGSDLVYERLPLR